MSLVFNDTTTQRGIVQIYEKEIGATPGDVSGNDDALKSFTADANLALDDFTKIAIEASGTWQYDDSNHDDHPIIKTDLVANQRDYSFSADGSGNLILDVYKLAVLPSATATSFVDIDPVDEQGATDASGLVSEDSATGTPGTYGKTGNSIFLDPKPGYNATLGLKVWINRESSYFTYDNDAKVPGIPGIFHRYLAIRPAEDYARRNSLSNYTAIRAERIGIEDDIRRYFAHREKDAPKRLTIKPVSYL